MRWLVFSDFAYSYSFLQSNFLYSRLDVNVYPLRISDTATVFCSRISDTATFLGLAGFFCTSAYWLDFTEPGCAGWFLLNQSGMVCFYWSSDMCARTRNKKCTGCAGWFLLTLGVLAGFYLTRVSWLVLNEPMYAARLLLNRCVLADLY